MQKGIPNLAALKASFLKSPLKFLLLYRVIIFIRLTQEGARVPQGYFVGPTLSLLYIIDLPDDVICSIAIYVDDTALYSKRHQASDLWQ